MVHFPDRIPMYTDMKLWSEVRRAVLVDGLSQTQACQQFKLHSDTLKKMLATPEPPGYQLSKPRANPKIEPFIPIIREILEHDRNMPRKQRHTGRRILERLRDEHGYDGGPTIFYEALADLRGYLEIAIYVNSTFAILPEKHAKGANV